MLLIRSDREDDCAPSVSPCLSTPYTSILFMTYTFDICQVGGQFKWESNSSSLGEGSPHVLPGFPNWDIIYINLIIWSCVCVCMYQVTDKMWVNELCKVPVWIGSAHFYSISVKYKILCTIFVLGSLISMYVFIALCLQYFFKMHSWAALVLLIPPIVLRQQQEKS